VAAGAGALALPCNAVGSLRAAVPTRETLVRPTTTVGIAQSARRAADDLAFADIKALVAEAVDLAGGLRGVVHNGDTVVLKPNLMCLYISSSGEKLYPNINGITTDWRVTRAVAQLVRKHNPKGRIYVMESSAFQQTRPTMAALRYTREHIPEVDAFVCLEESGKYEDWRSPKLTTVTLPKGVGLYPDHLKPNRSPEFYLNRRYHEADVLISIPVLKNHHIAGITGAIKNVAIGASPPNIYGTKAPLTVTQATPRYIVEKWGPLIVLERSRKISHDRFYLGLWMHDYFMCKPVDFVVTDGLQGSQNGPDIPRSCAQKSIEDNQMNMRMVLAGRDAVAVDTIHSLIIGFDPQRVNHLVNLSTNGCGSIARIRVAGRPVHSVRTAFELKGGRGAEAKQTGFKPPDLSIASAVVKDGKLDLRLKVDPRQLAKVELTLDERRLDDVVVEGFGRIVLDLGPTARSLKRVTVSAYDRFLACNEQTVRVTRQG
jgi:uncharacterized protein (DUF362 family)